MAATVGAEPPREPWPQQPEKRPKPSGPEPVLELGVEQPADASKQPVMMKAANRLRYIVPSLCRSSARDELGWRWNRRPHAPRVLRAHSSCAMRPRRANHFVFLREYFRLAHDCHKGRDDRVSRAKGDGPADCAA